MVNEFDPDGFPKTQGEVTKRQYEMDTERMINSLDWIRMMWATLGTELSKDEVFDIQQVSYYINEMYEAEDVRPEKEGKKYPVIDENLREYLREQAKHHRVYLLKLAAKKQRVDQRISVAKVSTFVVCMLIVVTLTAQGISTFAFGYDLWGNVADWGKGVLGISKDTVFSQNDITTVINGKTDTYENIENAIKSLDMKILYPSYLPDGIYINNIRVIEGEDTSIYYTFNDDNYNIIIRSKGEYEINQDDILSVGNYKCNIHDLESYYQIEFIDSNYLYSIIYSDYDTLIKIVENLKYN